MTETKKYYWLKLKKDFFKRHDIKIIESMENGKEYVLFYLKLLAESVSHNGELRFSETIPYNDKMLSTITNTNIDIVRSAIKILQKLELVQMMSDDTIYMEEVNKLLGVETEWADKKRKYREQQKQLEEKTSEGQKKTMSDKSKILELETDKEIKKESDKSPLPYFSISLSNLIFSHSKTKTTQKQIEAGAKIINDINRLDGYSEADIKSTIEWGLNDLSFWHDKIQSPAGLRKKRNGSADITKFAKIYGQWKSIAEAEEKEKQDAERRKQEAKEWI